MYVRPAFAKAAFTVMYANFAVNGLASLITLCLIFSMWRAGRLTINLYTKCVIQMTFLQLIFEITVPFYFIDTAAVPFAQGAALGYTSTARTIEIGGILFGGVGASAWSMMLLLSALMTVEYGRQPTPKEQAIAGVVLNSLLVAYSVHGMVTCHAAWWDESKSQDHWITFDYYRVIRLALIILSAICLLRLYQVMMRATTKGERFRSPLFHLLKKIAPYNIILIVVRFGGTTYQFIYGESITKIPASAGGMQIFWLFTYVSLMPAASIGLMIAFLVATAGAKRSLIQMLHLERVFSLPPAPAKWAEGRPSTMFESEIRSSDHSIGSEMSRESRLRRIAKAQEEHERLAEMDEHDLATEVSNFTYTDYAMRMSGQKEADPGDSEKRPRKGTSSGSMSMQEEL